MNEEDTTPDNPDFTGTGFDVPSTEEDDTSTYRERHHEEPVNDEAGKDKSVKDSLTPEDFADPEVRDAVGRAGDEFERELAAQLKREGFKITGRFASDEGPIGFLGANPAEFKVLEPKRAYPVGGLSQLDSQVDFDRSVESIRNEMRELLRSSLTGYASVAGKNRAADYLAGALVYLFERRYHAVWKSADYYKSAMESWKRAAGDTEKTGQVLNSGGPLPDHAYGETIPVAGDFEFLSLAKHTIPDQVTAYVAAMEVQRTNEWCRCQWIVHPDDVDLPAHGERKRRMRRGDTHPQCAVHTKEGFILGFFEWVFRDQPEASTEDTSDPAQERITDLIADRVMPDQDSGITGFTLNNGDEIPVRVTDDGTVRCASTVNGVPCGMEISPAGDRECPLVTKHDGYGIDIL